MKFTFISILFFLLVTIQSFAQEVEEGTVLGKGKIVTMDTIEIEGQYIVFSKDSLEYYVKDSEESIVIGLDEVSSVARYDGNYSKTGMWIGAIGGAVLGAVVAIGNKKTETTNAGFYKIEETKISTWPIYLFTFLGGLIGYFIGESSEDWETVYSGEVAFIKNIEIKNNQYGTHLSYKIHF